MVLADLRRLAVADGIEGAAWIAVLCTGILPRRLIAGVVMNQEDTATLHPGADIAIGIAAPGIGIDMAMRVAVINRLDAALPRRRVMVGAIIGRWPSPDAQVVDMVGTIRGIADDGNGVAVLVDK